MSERQGVARRQTEILATRGATPSSAIPSGTTADDVASDTLDVSVVVVSWNTREDLRRCLASIERETPEARHEVFVVDNASADGSAAMVRAEFPRVRLLANDANRGFAAANNQAFALARGRYVLVLNPDTVVTDRAIERTIRLADADPTIGVLGCQVLLREGEVQRTCFRFPTVLDQLVVSTGLDRVLPPRLADGPTMKRWDRRSARDVDVVSGMYMLVRKSALDEVGPMDEGYFVYAEEADLCFRLRNAGWRCVFTPLARIVHTDGGGRSTSQVRVRMHVQLQKSMLHFHRKNRGAASWLAVKSIYVATNALRAVWFTTLSPVSGDRSRERARCARAALRYHLLGAEPAA
jgi:GT2 family glycosyltransferase